MARKKLIPNGTLMRWKYNLRRDEYLDVRILSAVKREKRQWQKYHVQRTDAAATFIVQANTLYPPVPKFNTVEEADAWMEANS